MTDSVRLSTLFDNSYSWKVEFTTQDVDANGNPRTYRSNKAVTVVCRRAEDAMQEVKDRWGDAEIIKVYRGERWGNEGVIVVGMPLSD
jgi:hypothetical protein